jgi:hypothetical protein
MIYNIYVCNSVNPKRSNSLIGNPTIMFIHWIKLNPYQIRLDNVVPDKSYVSSG